MVHYFDGSCVNKGWGSPNICYFHIGAVALTSGFANGKGQIWLDRVSCLGTETRLVDCPANPMGNNNCGHVQDAGVSCTLGRSCRSQFGVL